MKFIYILVFVLSICSCSYYAVKKYHLHQHFDFKTKSAYLNEFKKKIADEKIDLLYLDSSTYLSFYTQKISRENDIVYLGCFLNDSTSLKKSSSLNENNSCAGRVKEQIKFNLSLSEALLKDYSQREPMRDFIFREVATGSKISLNNDKDLKIMIIYASGFGSYYDELYKWICYLKSQSILTCKIYFVSIDPIYLLK